MFNCGDSITCNTNRRIIIMRMQSVQFSSVPYTIGSSGGHAAERQQRSSSSLVCRRPCEQFWHGQGCPLFDVVHQAFLLPTTASPTLQGALKDGFGEAVMARDMPESWWWWWLFPRVRGFWENARQFTPRLHFFLEWGIACAH